MKASTRGLRQCCDEEGGGGDHRAADDQVDQRAVVLGGVAQARRRENQGRGLSGFVVHCVEPFEKSLVMGLEHVTEGAAPRRTEVMAWLQVTLGNELEAPVHDRQRPLVDTQLCRLSGICHSDNLQATNQQENGE